MKNATFTFEYIEPGTRIVYLTPTGIKEGLITAVKPILPFDIRLHEETQLTIDYCVQVNEPLKPLYDEWLDLNSVIYAEDFDALIDILSNRYYLLRLQQPEVKQQRTQQQPVLNPASDEDIAKRTTYLCSDGKFYTITNYPQANNEGYTYQGVGNWVINQLDLDGYDLFVEAENTLFNHCGCEVCRIIEDDKGRFVIQDRMCENSGFIFMSLEQAKIAALWLMEVELGENFIDAAEQAAVSMKSAVDTINSSDPSANYQELFLCKSGDVFYMCAGSNGSFADYELWLYPKGSSTGAIFIHPDWRIIEEYIFKSQLLQAEYSINMDMIIDKNSGHRKRGDEYYIRNAKGQVVGSDKSYLGALNFARRIKREADEAAETKNNTRITLPSDDAVYITEDGSILAMYPYVHLHRDGFMYRHIPGIINDWGIWRQSIVELEEWLDAYHHIKYIIRSTDSEKPEYKAFIGRTAETTGFVFTDKDTAVKSTLEVNMGIVENTITEELEGKMVDIPETLTASSFCEPIYTVYISKDGQAYHIHQVFGKKTYEIVNYNSGKILSGGRMFDTSFEGWEDYGTALKILNKFKTILYEIKVVYGSWRICKKGTEHYVKVPGSDRLEDAVRVALKYIAGNKTDK